MIQLSHILCPVDFSAFSRHALAHAGALARWYDAKVTVLHVWSALPPPMPFGDVPAVAMAMLPEQREEIIKQLNAMVESTRAAGLRVTVELSEGNVVPEVLERVDADHADLIVVGTHGRSGFERLVLGSVTEKILRKAKVPVLTVPKGVAEADLEKVHYKHVLCALDSTDPATPALLRALSLATETDAELTLFHVVEPLPEPTLTELNDLELAQLTRRMVADWRERLEAAVPASAREGCTVKVDVEVGKPWRAILQAAQDRNADLIVLGVQGRTTVDLMLFGSTTHHVVRQAHCPVLTVRG